MKNTRQTTNKLLDMINEGALDAMVLAHACMVYMSEEEVEDMARMNELIVEEPIDELFEQWVKRYADEDLHDEDATLARACILPPASSSFH